ncbi:MAG TPA: cation-transporting P-type ATPase, partial [Christiangramia sp.]|nr:cation-transporting P-type ATPase [Christiangramia sp.]
MIKNAHSLTVEEVINQLNTHLENGLSTEIAAVRLKNFGKNVLSRHKPKSAWKIFLEQLQSPIVYILIAAMFLAFIFSEALEGVAILLVIAINTIIGFLMEFQAIRSFSALQKMVQTTSTVIQEGEVKKVSSDSLVPGDLILVKAGDVIPADARIIEQNGLLIKESMLTGESEEVEKSVAVLPLETRVTERSNMLFNGTIVSRGDAKAIISATGDSTIIGDISAITIKGNEKRKPLQKKLTSLTNWLILFTLILTVAIAVTGLLTSNNPELMLKTAIALAVAAIPEGLPVVATITLARGMKKLSKRKVVIKKLESVQTLGETNIICTDKTGTLTENKMKLEIIEFDKKELVFNQPISRQNISLNFPEFDDFLRVAVLCNNSNPVNKNIQGDAIDDALINFTKDYKLNALEICCKYPQVGEIPFDANSKIMATINKKEGEFEINVKGAPEAVLSYCTLLHSDGELVPLINKENWLDKVEKHASNGLKVLLFANKISPDYPEKDQLLTNLALIGIVGFLDPPRNDIKEAIKIYEDAGIKVKMITGDHPGTASNIAEAIGLIEGNYTEKVVLGTSFNGFNKINEDERDQLLKARLFARMLPEQKLDLVKFFQKNEGVVGMLGDGVNDAPALRIADIGISMGLRGTEAAKEVADVILLDDKFTSIKLAIHQGRAIFENIRYFVIFLISCNLAEVISVTIASFSNLPLPLLPLQILNLNLVTDIFPALALGMGKGSEGIMQARPRPANGNILTRKHWIDTITYGIVITISVLGMVSFAHLNMELSNVEVNNMAFNTLVLAQLLNIFNLPPRETSFVNNEITR